MKLSNNILFFIITLLVTGIMPPSALATRILLDKSMPKYNKVSGIAGNLFTVGAHGMMDLITLWSIEFRHHYPNVRVFTQSADTAAGISKFVDGKAQLLLMTRLMTTEERFAFYKKQTYHPTAIRVAFDMLAVFVHQENPLEKLTIQQLSAIYSLPDTCAGNKGITLWGELGLEDSWQAQPIEIHGRGKSTGTDEYFTQQVLCSEQLNPLVTEQKSDGDMLQAVTDSMAAIGYAGITSLTETVKILPLAIRADATPVEAIPENTIAGRYPLTRSLYIYVNKQADKLLPALVREFLKLALSRPGQSLVTQYGYVPLSGKMAKSAQLSINGNAK